MTKPHEVLGIHPNAGEAAIDAAFRKAAKTCHPDLLGGDRTGEFRLRRLIAARDYLKSKSRRFLRSGRASAEPLQLPPPGRDWTFAIAGAITGAGLLLVLFFISSQPEAAVPPPDAFKTAAVYEENVEVPDAGSAEIKAIRDVRESAAWRGAGPANRRSAAAETARESAHEPQFRKVSSGRFSKAMTQAAAQLSRGWRKFAAKLQN